MMKLFGASLASDLHEGSRVSRCSVLILIESEWRVLHAPRNVIAQAGVAKGAWARWACIQFAAIRQCLA